MINLIMLTVDAAAEAGGYTIATVGYVIVFIALIILVGIFIALPKIFYFISNKKQKKDSSKLVSQEPQMDANINVAIAMSIHLYFSEIHDKESNIITIQNVQKQYSPWSSKIYGVQNQPRRTGNRSWQ